MSRYSLQYPLNYSDPPNRKPVPWSEDPDHFGQYMAPQMIKWGAKRVAHGPAPTVFTPVYPGQKPMQALPPNFHGVHAYRQQDIHSNAYHSDRNHRWFGLCEERAPFVRLQTGTVTANQYMTWTDYHMPTKLIY